MIHIVKAGDIILNAYPLTGNKWQVSRYHGIAQVVVAMSKRTYQVPLFCIMDSLIVTIFGTVWIWKQQLDSIGDNLL